MGDKTIDVVKGVYRAFGRGDLPAVLAAMADDIESYEAEGMPYVGLDHGPDAAAQKVLGHSSAVSLDSAEGVAGARGCRGAANAEGAATRAITSATTTDSRSAKSR